MKIINFAVLFFFIGCASSQKVRGIDGNELQLITCSQLSRCYEKAAEVCEGQFETVKTETKEIVGPLNNYTEQIELLVKCIKP